MPSANDFKYLFKLDPDRYVDFSKDFDALPAFNRLAHAGYCRVVWDGPAWRVAQSAEQKKMTIAAFDRQR